MRCGALFTGGRALLARTRRAGTLRAKYLLYLPACTTPPFSHHTRTHTCIHAGLLPTLLPATPAATSPISRHHWLAASIGDLQRAGLVPRWIACRYRLYCTTYHKRPVREGQSRTRGKQARRVVRC